MAAGAESFRVESLGVGRGEGDPLQRPRALLGAAELRGAHRPKLLLAVAARSAIRRGGRRGCEEVLDGFHGSSLWFAGRQGEGRG